MKKILICVGTRPNFIKVTRFKSLAKKYNLEIKTVVKPDDEENNFKVKKEAYSGSGVLINSKFLNGFKVPEESINQTIKLNRDNFLSSFHIKILVLHVFCQVYMHCSSILKVIRQLVFLHCFDT